MNCGARGAGTAGGLSVLTSVGLPEETDINCISSVGFSKYHHKLSWPMKIHCFPIVNVLKVQFSQGNMKGMSS
jgi:hypothetical protein